MFRAASKLGSRAFGRGPASSSSLSSSLLSASRGGSAPAASAAARASTVLTLRRMPVRFHCDSPVAPDAKDVHFSFVDKDGKVFPVKAKEGWNLVQTAHSATPQVELEGACECSLACSTCHVVLQQKVFDSLEPASEEEEDLLDLAFGLTATSRLGCQVKVSAAAFEGTTVTLPAATRNFYVDGHKPQPH